MSTRPVRPLIATCVAATLAAAVTLETGIMSDRARATSPQRDPPPFTFGNEGDYGYVQARASAGTLYVSGQYGHGPDGTVPAGADFQRQIAQAYANAKTVLEHYGLTPADVIDELIMVRDLADNLRHVPTARKSFYGPNPIVASTILETPRLALASMSVEIKLIARLRRPDFE